MAKPNKAHHDRCVKYKNRGQREINKKIKQEKDAKRRAKFAARRENGKCYEYKPLPKEPEDKNSREWREWVSMKRERAFKAYVNDPYKNKTEYQKWTSIMRKVQNEIDEEIRLIKKEEAKISSKNEKKK